MKPFVWITALIFACLFLAGAVFFALDLLGRADILTNPETKIAAGWFVTGFMFLGLGIRGWRAHRRKRDAAKL